jgi:hypothetical protein
MAFDRGIARRGYCVRYLGRQDGVRETRVDAASVDDDWHTKLIIDILVVIHFVFGCVERKFESWRALSSQALAHQRGLDRALPSMLG